MDPALPTNEASSSASPRLRRSCRRSRRFSSPAWSAWPRHFSRDIQNPSFSLRVFWGITELLRHAYSFIFYICMLTIQICISARGVCVQLWYRCLQNGFTGLSSNWLILGPTTELRQNRQKQRWLPTWEHHPVIRPTDPENEAALAPYIGPACSLVTYEYHFRYLNMFGELIIIVWITNISINHYISYNYSNHCICLHNESMLSLHISPLLLQGACAFPPQITCVPAATFWSRNLSTAWIPPVRSTVKPLQVGELNPEPAASCAVFWNARVDKWHNQVWCIGF